MTAGSEFSHKHSRVAAWLQERGASAALFLSPANLAWLACGGELSRPDSRPGILLSADRAVLLAPGDDIDRIRQEEVRGLGMDIVARNGGGLAALAAQARSLMPQRTTWKCDVAGAGLDHDPTSDGLRQTLMAEEIDRLRRLGRDAASALEEVAAECFRGIIERDAAGRLAAECVRRQIIPRVILAGADERFETYTRPLPKGGDAEHVLMLALVATRGGLHVTLSRTICLARPNPAMVERYERMAQLVAGARHASVSGARLGDIVEQIQSSVPSESLGGIVAYRWPEVDARADSNWKLANGQALAWSLATPGVRCEDTHLVGAGGIEALTISEDWPHRSFTFDDRDYEVPDLLLL